MSVELQDKHLYLRAPQPGDVEGLFEAVIESAEEVGHWLPWCHAAYTREEAVAWIGTCTEAWQREDSYPFFIFDRATHQLLGGCGLNEIDRARLRANLGYWIRTNRMGHGIATAAARLIAHFGLETLAFQRIEIVAAEENLASQRVAAKLGAHREGLARHRLRIRDIPHDAYVYSLIPSDLRTLGRA